MMKVFNFLITWFGNFYVNLKNILNFNFKKSITNNVGLFRTKMFISRASKYKFFLYFYILITMALCPWLDNLFNEWYNNEPLNMYYMLGFFILLNFIINIFMVIPAKDTLSLKLFILKVKSFYFYLVSLLTKIYKLTLFLKNEILLKSYFFTLAYNFFLKISNYFIYWRPLFKRFSYFGFYRLTKSKFFKKIK